MFAETETGSIYQIDVAGRRARRVTGLNAPTPRTGADGEWHGIAGMLPVQLNRRMLFEWSPDITPAAEPGKRPGTVTSRVVDIVGDEAEIEAAARGL